MTLKLCPAVKKTFKKVCVYEVRIVNAQWTPTGRRMYLDPDAPLDHLEGWKQGMCTGEMAMRQCLFNQIADIVETQYKRLEVEDRKFEHRAQA